MRHLRLVTDDYRPDDTGPEHALEATGTGLDGSRAYCVCGHETPYYPNPDMARAALNQHLRKVGNPRRVKA